MELSTKIAQLESDLRHHLAKSDSDDNLIALLKQQNAQQAREMEEMSNVSAQKIRQLSQERDEAVQKSTEVSGLLNQAADTILSGLRKMAGDQCQQPYETTTLIHDHEEQDAEKLRGILYRLDPQKTLPPINQMSS